MLSKLAQGKRLALGHISKNPRETVSQWRERFEPNRGLKLHL